MDEVDIENADDLNELEARLYSQVHHEPSGGDYNLSGTATYDEPPPPPVRQVTSTSVVNKSYDRTQGRYWNEKTNFKKFADLPTTRPRQQNLSPNVVQVNKEKQSTGNREINENPVETVDKTFQPPVKNLSKLRVNPFASGNGLKSKGSSTIQRPRNKNTPIVDTNKFKRTEPKNGNNNINNKGPFTRQQNKLSNAIKYEKKKQKSKAAKAKMKMNNPSGATVDLIDSDDEDDDVIEVPLPPPKIVSLDSSSEDEKEDEDLNKSSKEEKGENQTQNFAKPEVQPVKENSSRCTSPCSVISDDFIGHTDRSRLLEESGCADDEDLLLLQVDVDSLLEAPEKSTDKQPSDASQQHIGGEFQKPDYVVTQNNFRAVDVYESESDMHESVYSKGSKTNKPSVVVNLDKESSSSDDVVEIDITQKTKRLRKRRSSSTNKDVATDSEEELQERPRRSSEVKLTKVPHIAYGQAILNSITKESDLHQAAINNSDNEFIANLNTLAQGESATLAEPAGNESDKDEEEATITARAIAESVLNKVNKRIDSTTTVESNEPVFHHDEEANDALPEDGLAELDQIFNVIDNMDNLQPEIDDSGDSNESVELVAPLPVKTNANRSSYNNRINKQKEMGDPVYNVVYSENVKMLEGGGIGWNEEMRKFYNNSWHGERFSVKAICSQMKTTKTLWKIYTDDRFPKHRKYSNHKCMNCCEFGHIRSKCPKPKKTPVCYMCGEKGHYEPRCPNTICLRCGNKTRMFTKSCNACNYQNRLVCPICKTRGHSLNLCPDKWRRYHSTTKPNQYPNNKVEYKNRKICCFCGNRGHLPEHCRIAIHTSEYPLFPTEIRSHQKAYDDIAVKTIRSGIGYNLMYKPNEEISFELAENKTKNQYYGRFLLAVGMGYLLARKRKISKDKENEESPVKQKKINTELKDYVVNPFAKAALGKSPAKSIGNSIKNSVVDQDKVEEKAAQNESLADKSASTNESTINVDEEVGNPEVDPNTYHDKLIQHLENSSANTFKTPNSNSPGRAAKKSPENIEVVDSDSNYSFSEHFEPSQNENQNPDNPDNPDNPSKAREMDPLPDFIPIVDDDDADEEETEQLISAGISKKYVYVETDEEDESSNQLPNLPCDAKIYLTAFHSKFLLSPDGNKFLIDNSKTFNIKARLEWTSVGHILIIHGLRCNQDKFHIELLHKFRELSEKMNRTHLEKSQKVPKKTDVLIRFLRENINQLLTNLGNPNDLFRRLNTQEKLLTKAGWKSAEKTRRILNMILIGQAGLRNGSVLLDKLLSQLRNLLDDNNKEDTVSNELRDEIDSNWKLIFSSHRHDKYAELVEAYNNMPIKNRLQNINIDPRLLGKKMLDTTLTKEQKDKMDKAVENVNTTPCSEKSINSPSKLVPNPVSIRTPNRAPKTPVLEKKLQKNTPSNSPSTSTSTLTPVSQKKPNQQNQSQKKKQLVKKMNSLDVQWETRCTNLLEEIDENNKKAVGGPKLNKDSKSASMFWSREALKYIDECIELGKSNQSFLDKLSRVQIKSQKGLLSYNDYRAIIKIHNAIKNKQ